MIDLQKKNLNITIHKNDFLNFNYNYTVNISDKITLNNLKNSFYLRIFFSIKDFSECNISLNDDICDYEQSIFKTLMDVIEINKIEDEIIRSDIELIDQNTNKEEEEEEEEEFITNETVEDKNFVIKNVLFRNTFFGRQEISHVSPDLEMENISNKIKNDNIENKNDNKQLESINNNLHDETDEKYIRCDEKLTLTLNQQDYKLVVDSNIKNLDFFITDSNIATITIDGILNPLTYGMTTITIQSKKKKKIVILKILKKQNLTFYDVPEEDFSSTFILFKSKIDSFLPIMYYSSDANIIFINEDKGYIRNSGEVEIIAYNEGNDEYESIEESQLLNINPIIKNISNDCSVNMGESLLLSAELETGVKFKKIYWYLNDQKLLTHNFQTLLISDVNKKNEGKYKVEIQTDTRSEKSNYINVTVLDKTKNKKKNKVNDANNNKVKENDPNEIKLISRDIETLSMENFYKKLMYNNNQSQNNYIAVYNMIYNDMFNKLHTQLYDYTSIQINKLILLVYEETDLEDQIIFFDINTSKVNKLNLTNNEFMTSSASKIYNILYNNFYDSIYQYLSNRIFYKLIQRVINYKFKIKIPTNQSENMPILTLNKESQVYKIYMQLISQLYKSLSISILKTVYKDIIISRKKEIKIIMGRNSSIDYKVDTHEKIERTIEKEDIYTKRESKINSGNKGLLPNYVNTSKDAFNDLNNIDVLRRTIDAESKSINVFDKYEYNNDSEKLNMLSKVDKLLYGKK
jgi:hypothetical protein